MNDIIQEKEETVVPVKKGDDLVWEFTIEGAPSRTKVVRILGQAMDADQVWKPESKIRDGAFQWISFSDWKSFKELEGSIPAFTDGTIVLYLKKDGDKYKLTAKTWGVLKIKVIPEASSDSEMDRKELAIGYATKAEWEREEREEKKRPEPKYILNGDKLTLSGFITRVLDNVGAEIISRPMISPADKTGMKKPDEVKLTYGKKPTVGHTEDYYVATYKGKTITTASSEDQARKDAEKKLALSAEEMKDIEVKKVSGGWKFKESKFSSIMENVIGK